MKSIKICVIYEIWDLILGYNIWIAMVIMFNLCYHSKFIFSDRKTIFSSECFSRRFIGIPLREEHRETRKTSGRTTMLPSVSLSLHKPYCCYDGKLVKREEMVNNMCYSEAGHVQLCTCCTGLFSYGICWISHKYWINRV